MAIMKRTQIFSLLILGILLIPLIPYFPINEYNPSSHIISNEKTSLSPAPIPNVQPEDLQPEYPNSAPSESSIPAPEEEKFEMPESQTGSGSPRIAQLTWNISRSFVNRNPVSDYTVNINKGMLYHDVSSFSRIGNISSNKDFIMVEDHDPLTGWRWYWPMSERDWPGEIVFMAFNITGLSPVELTEFAIYLYCPLPPDPFTGGLFNYTVFGAAPSGISGLGTMPDLSQPQGPWMQHLVPDLARGAESWVPLPTFPLVLDSQATYAGTFYFALHMMPGAAAGWVLMEDVGVPPDGDGDDEGDAWQDDSGLNFISGPSVDFFLVVALSRFYYPSELGITVNGTPVFDVYPNPGTGIWDGGWHSPAINMTNAQRYYNVTYFGPGVTFDVTWLGWFYENVFAQPRFTAYVYQDYVDWNVSFYADFPVLSIDRRITLSIGSDWTVNEVIIDGLNHMDWSIRYSPTLGGWWLVIDNAATGQWTILCESPDYLVDSEILDAGGQPISAANSSDTIFAKGYVQDDMGENATNGFGFLLVYDPVNWNVHWQINPLTMPPGGIVELNWSIWTTATYGGIHNLQILWVNGSEAGLTIQTLEVYVLTTAWISYEFPPEDEPVIRGDDVILEVYYINEWGLHITDAIATIINDTSGLEWGVGPGDNVPDYEWYNLAGHGAPGFYLAYIFTDNGSVGVLHNITMSLTSPYNQMQNLTKSFEIKTKETHILFFWEGQPLPGLDNVSSYWFTSPDPLINDSSLQFTILYTDEGGIPIKDANLVPYIVHGTLGVYKRLDWIDLSTVNSTQIGFYNITIDSNPIGPFAFHEGDSAYIVIYATKYGYEHNWSKPVWVTPQPRPSEISVPSEFQNIILYEDWQYPTIEHPTILRVVLRDALIGDDLSHGTVKAGVNGGQNTTLTLATPGIGLYEVPSLNTDDLTPGTYNVTIYAEANDFTDSIAVITLTVLAKQTINYEADSNFEYLTIPNLGQPWWLSLQLYLENTSSPLSSHSYGGLYRQPGMTFLPEGTAVTLTVTAQSGNYDPLIGYVGSDGWVHFEGSLTQEGEHQFYISLEGAENYVALTNMEIAPLSQPIYVMSMASIITQNLPTILIIAAIVIILPLGSVLTYRRYVLLPKRRQKLAKYQAIADTFSDVANLNRLLVLHKESGICVFDPFAEESQDATLVAGFLQAISTFGHDLGDSPGLAEDSDDARTLRELQYEGFRILINDGKFVRVALVLSGTPSEQLRGRLETFTGVFENRYKKDFEHWEGRVDQFNSASDLVEEVFLISLRHPHSVAPRKPRGAQLNSLESDIYKLSKELTLDREYIFLGQVLSTYLAAAKSDKLEALMGIYQLRMKGIFLPIQLAPVPPPDASAG